MIVELEKTGYTASESHPFISICAVIANNNSGCAVEFQFEVMLKVNATTEGEKIHLLPASFYYFIIVCLVAIVRKLPV